MKKPHTEEVTLYPRLGRCIYFIPGWNRVLTKVILTMQLAKVGSRVAYEPDFFKYSA